MDSRIIAAPSSGGMEMDFSPVWISLKTTVCSSAITFVLGIVAAWVVMFIKSKKWKAAVDGFLTIPLVLPLSLIHI